MDPKDPPHKDCVDCRWLDIQADAGRELFWCVKKSEDVTEGLALRKACDDFECPRGQDETGKDPGT